MYFAAKTNKPTPISPIGMLPSDNPCPENFKFSSCGICLPLEFRRLRSINFAHPVRQPKISVSCGCFDCPQNTFFSGFNICIKTELFKFQSDRKSHDCVTPSKPQQILEPSLELEEGIAKYLLAAGTGALGFMFLFFLKSKG